MYVSKRTPSKRANAWGFLGSGLVAETALTLDAGNEFDLPAGPYYLSTTFDPDTGKRLSACVTVLQDGHAIHVRRDYDPESGRARREERFDWPLTGGKVAGPGGAVAFYDDRKRLRLAYAAWDYGNTGYPTSLACLSTAQGCAQRRMHIATLALHPDRSGALVVTDRG